MTQHFYIAASNENIGKTTTTIGLFRNLKEQGYNVGYCKPVGQKSVVLPSGAQVNKDTVLFSDVMRFQIEPDIHNPIVIPRGFTQQYLEHPEAYQLEHQLEKARDRLGQLHDIVIYEGSGHAGVGSVLDLSNARVARIVGAKAILIVDGGIGSTIDKINLNLALFREEQVELAGVIINKVRPDKMEDVRHFVGLKLKRLGIPLLGVMPYERGMASPGLSEVAKVVEGKPLCNEDYLDKEINHIVSGALIEKKEYESLSNLLLAVNYRRLNSAMTSLQEIIREEALTYNPLAGILIHGSPSSAEALLKDFAFRDYVMQHHIPIIATSLDTYGSALRINNMSIKINARTPWKVTGAIEMVGQYIDLDTLLQRS